MGAGRQYSSVRFGNAAGLERGWRSVRLLHTTVDHYLHHHYFLDCC